MKTRKAMGPNDIPIEGWKCLGKIGWILLTRGPQDPLGFDLEKF